MPIHGGKPRKKIQPQTELISHLEDQNATLREYCMFLKKNRKSRNSSPGSKTQASRKNRKEKKMKTASDYIWYLKFKISNLEKGLDAYRSGNKTKKLRHDYEAVVREKDREIRKWKIEAARAYAQAATVRKYWSEIFDGLEHRKKREIQKAVIETRRMEQQVLAAEKKNEELEEKIKEGCRAPRNGRY